MFTIHLTTKTVVRNQFNKIKFDFVFCLLTNHYFLIFFLTNEVKPILINMKNIFSFFFEFYKQVKLN